MRNINSKNDVLALLQENKPALQRVFPLQRIGLFGSWARDEQTSQSDIDILVEVDSSIGLGFVTLADQLEKVLGRKVDLVSRRAIKPRLWAEIETDLIYI